MPKTIKQVEIQKNETKERKAKEAKTLDTVININFDED